MNLKKSFFGFSVPFLFSFLIFSTVFFFLAPQHIFADDVTNNLVVNIAPNGDVPDITVNCTVGHAYTEELYKNSLIAILGNFSGLSGGITRQFCDTGIMTFAGWNMNTALDSYNGVDNWIGYVLSPFKYAIIDSTNEGGCTSTASCAQYNLPGPWDGYATAIYLPSNTCYNTTTYNENACTLAAGPYWITVPYTHTWVNFLDTIPTPPAPGDPNDLPTTISSSGDVATTSIACISGHDYTLSLVHEDAGNVTSSFGVVQRVFCNPGVNNNVIEFSGFNLNDKLLAIDPIWQRYVHTPLEYIIKDTTGIFACDNETCPVVNESGTFNNFDNSTYLASSTVYPTVGVGPVFDTSDGVTWFNANLSGGSGGGNGTGTSTPPISTSTPPTVTSTPPVIPPVATSTPPTASSTPVGDGRFDSILFLPGIEASRLYRPTHSGESGSEVQLWEPTSDQNVKDLFLSDAGTPAVGDAVYTRDVIDEAYSQSFGPNIYKSFLAQLGDLKADSIINDYSVVPYDWRLSIDDILAGGTVTGSGTASEQISYTSASADPYILSELRRLAAGSATGKVTIIAHSNGGLVAKALLQQLADSGDPLLGKIDKLILVAVPQLGTPSAIGALLHGYDQGIPAGMPVFLSDAVARGFAQNSPAAYNLLPSADYLSEVSTPVVTFDSSTLPDWASKYGDVISSPAELHTFLTDGYDRVDASTGDTRVPDQLREPLLTAAENEHTILDNWTPPASMQVTDIAGWGVPTTMSGIKYVSGKIKCEDVLCAFGDVGSEIEPEPTWTIDGDGVVVAPSALWTDGDASVVRYWVDLDNYNSDHWFSTAFGFFPFDHKKILEVPELRTFIQNIIEATSTDVLPQYISTSTPIAGATDTRLIYALHSPLTLDMYDSNGDHTGVSTTTGMVEENIPNTYYLALGDDKYIFTDDQSPVHITMSGYATSTFTLSVDQLQGDTDIASTTFADIPVTPSTQVSLNDSQGTVNTVSTMSVDENGDGQNDITLTPQVDATVTVPPTPIIQNPVLNITPASTGSTGGGFDPTLQNISQPIPINFPLIQSPQIQQLKQLPQLQQAPIQTHPQLKHLQQLQPLQPSPVPHSSLVAQAISAPTPYFLVRVTSWLGSFFRRLYSIIKRK